MLVSSSSSPDPKPDPNRLLTVREGQKLIGLYLDSVRRQLRAGKLQGMRVGRDWRIPERVLLARRKRSKP